MIVYRVYGSTEWGTLGQAWFSTKKEAEKYQSRKIDEWRDQLNSLLDIGVEKIVFDGGKQGMVKLLNSIASTPNNDVDSCDFATDPTIPRHY